LGSVVERYEESFEGGLEWISSPPTFATFETRRGTRWRGGESRRDKMKQVNILSRSFWARVADAVDAAKWSSSSGKQYRSRGCRSSGDGIWNLTWIRPYVNFFDATKDFLIPHGLAYPFVQSGRLYSSRQPNYNIIFQHPVALRYNLYSCFPSVMQQY
jgi:hypothetical protein